MSSPARRTDGGNAQAHLRAAGGVFLFPGLPRFLARGRRQFPVASRRGLPRAPDALQLPRPLLWVARLPWRQTHGRAWGPGPDRRQAEHRSVAGQGTVRATPACAPPGTLCISSFSDLRPSHFVREPFKVLHGHLVRAPRVLRGRTHCSARVQTRKLGTHRVLRPVKSGSLPGMGLHSPRTGFPGALAQCPRSERCILPQTEEVLHLLLVKLISVVNL